MKKFRSKTGRVLILRTPAMADVEGLLEFINKLALEDTFILRSKQDTLTLDQEKLWLREKLEDIKNKKAVLITAFSETKVVGQVEVEVGELRGRYLGKLGISVDKDFRGEGLASELMKEAEAASFGLGLKILHLEVFAGNDIARHLYEKMGFIKFGELPESIDYRGKLVDEAYYYKRLE